MLEKSEPELMGGGFCVPWEEAELQSNPLKSSIVFGSKCANPRRSGLQGAWYYEIAASGTIERGIALPLKCFQTQEK
jgi:hypothetical protein